MATAAAQTQWNPITEGSENMEAQNADADYEARKNVDFAWNAQKVNESLYGPEHTCTPEEKEHNAEQFVQRYAADLSVLLSPDASLEIWKQFEISGDLEAAVFMVIAHMSIWLENMEQAAEQITQYLDPRLTSARIDSKLRSEDGITVESGMNASYINALSGSQRHVDFTPEADSIKPGDTLSYGEDATDLQKNDTSIGTLNEDNMDLNEIVGHEFWENRYAPIINMYTVTDQDFSEPLHDIKSGQVEEIWVEYAKWTDIVEAMQGVLWRDHEAIWIVKDLDNPDSVEERRSQMYEDLWVESECRVDPSTGEGGDMVTNLLSENYVQILGPDGEPDTRASVILATQVSANKTIEWKHTFTRSKEFNQAYVRIQEGSNSPEELQKDLLLIHSTVNNAEWVRWRRSLTQNQRMRTAEQKALFLSAEFRDIQALFVQAQRLWDKEAIREQQWKAVELEWEVNSWDATTLSGGELDLMAQLDEAASEMPRKDA